jgi:hypothetical protein
MLSASAVWAQTSKSTPKSPEILGYLDPQTGAFRLLPHVAASGPSAALTNVQGRIAVSLTITVKSAKITDVSCTVLITAVGENGRVYEESATVDALESANNQRSCKVNVPYSWDFDDPANANLTTSYVVNATGTGAPTGEGPRNRSTKVSPLSTQKVPSNGGEIPLIADVTI